MARGVESYVPALGARWLTRFYDPILRLALKEDRFRRLLVEQTAVPPNARVLDLGCGTGTLTILLKQAHPDAHVVGLDGDPEILSIARSKIEAAGLDVELFEARAEDPPFEGTSFDRVVSSLLFHHLSPTAKRATFRKIHELLRPTGELHVADWGKAHNPWMRLAFLGVQLLDGFESTAENVAGKLPLLLADAGFRDARETHHEATLFGTLSLYRARRE